MKTVKIKFHYIEAWQKNFTFVTYSYRVLKNFGLFDKVVVWVSKRFNFHNLSLMDRYLLTIETLGKGS